MTSIYDNKNQEQQFSTALSLLSPEERATYDKANTPTKSPVSPVATINTDSAVQKINNQNQFLTTTYPQTAPLDPKTTDVKTGNTSPKAYFANDLGQEAEFTQEQLNDPSNQSFLNDNKYVQTRTEGPNYTSGTSKSLQGGISDIDTQIQSALDSFKNYNVNNDPDYQQYAQSLQKNLEQAQKLTREAGANNANAFTAMLGGRARTGSQAKAGGMFIEEANQKINDLNQKEADALLQARLSFKDRSYENFNKTVNTLRGIRSDKAQALQDYNKVITDYNNTIREEIKTTKKDISGVLTDSAKNGAPAEVQNAISRSQSLSEAVKAAGDYLQAGTGIVGEYNFYKKDALTKGQVPLSFDEYQTRDANRKLKTAQAVNAAGLNNTQMNTALKLSDDFEQRSKEFFTQRDAFNRIQSSASDPSAAGDLALIFNYMKVLDPNSTVREGEFATAQNSGSAWEILGAKYNKVASGERLTQTQRDDFVNRATKLFNGAKKQQDVTIKDFSDRAGKYGVPADLVVRSSDATSVGQDIVQSEEQAKTKVLEYGKQNPAVAQKMRPLLVEVQPELGRPMTYEEVMQLFNIK